MLYFEGWADWGYSNYGKALTASPPQVCRSRRCCWGVRLPRSQWDDKSSRCRCIYNTFVSDAVTRSDCFVDWILERRRAVQRELRLRRWRLLVGREHLADVEVILTDVVAVFTHDLLSSPKRVADWGR